MGRTETQPLEALSRAYFGNSDAMDELGCKRYCCRRMIMTHVDLIEKLLKYVIPKDQAHSCQPNLFQRPFRLLTFLLDTILRNETQRRLQ
jgi:hypothetical protein